MRVVYVTQELPNAPLTGAHTRTLSMLRALSRAHEVAVVGRLPAGAEAVAVQDLCVDVRPVRSPGEDHRGALRRSLSRARKTLTPVPLIAQSRDDRLAAAVDEAVALHSPRAVQLFNMYTVHYRRRDCVTLLDLPDVVSGLCEAAAAARPVRYAAARFQRRRAELAERTLLRDVLTLTINEDDAARLASLHIDSFTIPLAIGLPPLEEDPAGSRRIPPGIDGGRPLQLLFVGSYLHRPNVEAGRFLERRLLPALVGRGCRVRLTIAGRAVRPLDGGRLHGIGERPAGRSRGAAGEQDPASSLRHLADVPDLAPLYREADIVVIPLAHGGGTKNKTLEAMAFGRPVVGSPQAFTGLKEGARAACRAAPLDPVAMADAVLALAGDPQTLVRMGGAGRAYVAREHSQEIVDRRMDVLYDAVAEGADVAGVRRLLERAPGVGVTEA